MITNSSNYMNHGDEYTHIATNATTNISLGTNRIILKAIVVNTTAAGTITVKDGSGTVAIMKASIAEGTYLFGHNGIVIGGGCTVVTAAASDITVVWSNL
jgi:hypothetical protein